MRYLSSLVWFAALLGIGTVSCFGQTQDPRSKSTESRLRALVSEVLVESELSEVESLVTRKESYQALERNKALVACFSGSYPFTWNSSSGWDKLDVARERAMNACKARGEKGCQCREVYSNDSVTLSVPDSSIDEMLRRITKGRPVVSADLTPMVPPQGAADVLSDTLRPDEPKLVPSAVDVAFPLRAPSKVSLNGVSCHLDYGCLCSGYLQFGFTKIDPQSAEHVAVRDASRAGYTRCFEQSKDVLGRAMRKPRKFCQYVTRLDRPGAQLAPVSSGVMGILRDFGYRPIDRLWIEAATEVDAGLAPVAPPVHTATPLLLESAGEIFKVHAAKKDSGVGCALSATYSNRIFYSRGCKRTDDQCFSKAMALYMTELRRAFAASPLLAVPYTAAQRPPGEYWFRREKLPSEVLGGSPMREFSTYVVKWWRPTLLLGGFSGQENDLGGTHGSEMIYADITSAILVAVGNDRFRDATNDELPRFQSKVREAAWNALTRSCEAAGGKMSGDTCDLN